MQSFAQRCREAASKLGHFTAAELGDAVSVQSFEDQRRVRQTITDFVSSGEVERTGSGQYRYKGKDESGEVPIYERMHAAMRFLKKRFSINDIILISGSSRAYAQEFLRKQVADGFLKAIQTPGKRTEYLLINDPGPTAIPIGRKKTDGSESRRARRVEADFDDKGAFLLNEGGDELSIVYERKGGKQTLKIAQAEAKELIDLLLKWRRKSVGRH